MSRTLFDQRVAIEKIDQRKSVDDHFRRATPCTIDLRRLVDGCRHHAVRFEVVLVIFSFVRRHSEILEVSLRGTAIVFQLVLVVVGTSFQLGLVQESPSGDDSIIVRHLDISFLLLPEVEHLAT